MSCVETTAILMTDLVGSTGLATRVGPAAAERLRREHFALLREAIEVCGGREVKSLGDGLMVAFASVSSAVACAVAMQQAVERRNRRADEPLAIRVGLSVGDATREENDYFGTPVVEAARLCERAGGGQILARDLVASLTAGRGDDAFRQLDALELKGLGPVGAVEITWELPEQASLALPSRLQEVPVVGFVGRRREREQLRRLFEDAREGHRRVALVSGEPGIGKTRLCTHAAMEARAKGAPVLYGRAEEELSIPYGPWVEALSHYVELVPERVLQDHVARHGGELTRLVPALGDRLTEVPEPRETDPDTERYLLWGAVASLLGEAAGDLPLVLVLDDLHWADKPTLLLLRFVAAQGHGMRALILATYRESDLAPEHPLIDMIAALHREQGVERVALEGLTKDEVVEIMERAAGHELDEAGHELARELFHETDGNPFYTGQLLRHLLESGAIGQDQNGRWSVRGSLSELALPQSVREVIGHRARRLGEEAQAALQVASVIGRDFDAELLVRVADHGEERLLELLEQAVAASVLGESASVPGRFFFSHALIGHTLYEELGTTRRARLHLRIAQALEELCGDDPGARVGELAQHWAKASTAVAVPKAIAYARMAGERALVELAPEEAVRWFQQALEVADRQRDADSHERCELLIGLGEAQRRSGDTSKARATFEQAADSAKILGSPEDLARAALGVAAPSYYGSMGRPDELAVRLLQEALDAVGEGDSPLRATMLARLAGQAIYSGWSREQTGMLARQAVEMARRLGDPATLGAALHAHHAALRGAREHPGARLPVATELIELGEVSGDRELALWGHIRRVTDLLELGDRPALEAEAEAFTRLADELRLPAYQWWPALWKTMLALLDGRLLEVEQLALEALAIGQAGQGEAALQHYGAQLFLLRREQKRLAELEEAIRTAVEENPQLPAWRCALAHLYAELGREEEARAEFELLAANDFGGVLEDFNWGIVGPGLAQVCAFLSDTGRAQKLYELLLPVADRCAFVGWAAICAGAVSRYLGLLATTLGRWKEAQAHFEDALVRNTKLGSRPLVAHTQHWYARMFLARGMPGDREMALDLLARSLDVAEELGMVFLADQAGAAKAEAEAVVSR